MVSKILFKTQHSVTPSNTINNAGSQAYSLSDKAALTQLAVTGCFNNTFYVSDKEQLKQISELADKVEPLYLAKLAVYARQHGHMKDVPSFLAALLASKDSNLLAKIFPKVIDDPKMLRNFVQIIRSGTTKRKSFGSKIKKLIQNYLESLTDEQLFRANIGNNPSLSDIIKMVHPKPLTIQRSNLYSYLLKKSYDVSLLPPVVRAFEDFKSSLIGEIPNVPFQMLTSLPLTEQNWKDIAENATWNQTRMNLNTFARHNVFNNKLTDIIANKLQSPGQVKYAKVLPYQLFTAFQNLENVPNKVMLALQKAADLSLDNVPEFSGKVYVLVDTSGSMSSPVTGDRGSVTTKTRCIDVAALFASAIMRKNSNAEIIPFDTRVHAHRLNPLDSIMTNAEKLASFGGGGTNCAAPIEFLNAKSAKADLLIMISDNESWRNNSSYSSGTGMANEWNKFKKRNPNAKLVCLDITPNVTVQTKSDNSVLNLGGFSDSVFEIIAKFTKNPSPNFWVEEVEKTLI